MFGSALFIFALFGMLFWRDFYLCFLILFNYNKAKQIMDSGFLFRSAQQVFKVANKLVNYQITIKNKVAYKDLPEQFIIISNHQSLVDIPLVAYLFPQTKIRFVVKKALSRFVPFISPIIRMQRHAIIERKGSMKDTVKALNKLTKNVQGTNICPIVFPEGTRSRNGEIGKFHSGAFKTLSQSLKIPVVVVAIQGASEASHGSNFLTGIHNGKVNLSILSIEPSPSGKQETLDLLERSKHLISDHISSS